MLSRKKTIVTVLTPNSIAIIVIDIFDFAVPEGELAHPVHAPADASGSGSGGAQGQASGTGHAAPHAHPQATAAGVGVEAIRCEVVTAKILAVVVRRHVVDMHLVAKLSTNLQHYSCAHNTCPIWSSKLDVTRLTSFSHNFEKIPTLHKTDSLIKVWDFRK